jgi:general secretion pathway protein C
LLVGIVARSKGRQLLRLLYSRITIAVDVRYRVERFDAMTSRRAIILVFVLGLTFLIAHTINAVIAEALFVPSGIAVPRPADQDSSTTRSPSALAEHVRMSGLFPLPPDPVGATSSGISGGVGGPTRQPLNLAAKIKLLGIVMGDRGGVSAIIEELASKRQLFFRLHDHIPDIGEISEIQRSGIIVQQGNEQEFLELSTGMERPSTTHVVSTGPPAAVGGGQIKKVLDRREVEQALNDLPKLLSQARAAPVLANGAITGFRLDYIAPTSFYEKIGLQYGDILKQVNGVEIKDPGTMLSLFQQLRNEKSVKLDILRNNQRATMMFDIR